MLLRIFQVQNIIGVTYLFGSLCETENCIDFEINRDARKLVRQ